MPWPAAASQDALDAVDGISLDLLPADLDLDLDDARALDGGAGMAVSTDDSGTDTGGSDPRRAKQQRDPVLARAAQVRLRLREP